MTGILDKHNYPVEAWVKMSDGHKSPDSRIRVQKIVKLPDKCFLTLTYEADQSPAAALGRGMDTKPQGDFYAGKEPVLRRVTVDAIVGGSTVALELAIAAPCAVYRMATRTLYLCDPERIGL